MAATAYASLVSLLNTMDQIHTHPLVSTFFDVNQNKSLSEKLNFFLDFVEKYSDADSREVEDLLRRIADAAHEAENIIEVHAADRVRRRESPNFFVKMQKIIEEMEPIKEQVVKVKEETGGKSSSFLSDLPLSSSSSSSSAPPATDEATTMVGFDHYARKFLDELLVHDVDRQIISITGMGGIGKTTLARNLYENSLVVRHFSVRVWVTVSQDSSARRVYLQALSSIGGCSINMDTADDTLLSVELHRALFNRRYLIILDDVWSVEIWNKIKNFFPDNKNGSRIVVTTRESKLVDYMGSSTIPVETLDKVNSWKLFCEKTFPKQDFPLELEDVGKKILKNCGGLPLAIAVVGGLLRKSPRTEKHWEKVAKDKSLILNSGENKPSDILYLSYKYLPICLKPCFLYLGLYPEDYVIDESELIKLWIAEGFIKANRGQSLEEVGGSYINELIDRNLLLIRFFVRRPKEYFTHDLVRDLCIQLGEEEKFFRVQRSIDGDCHFIAYQSEVGFYPQESHASGTISLFKPLKVHTDKRVAPFKTRLLRVLFHGEESPYYDALQEVNMRLLRYHPLEIDHCLLPSLVPRFWSLQTLVVRAGKEVVAPVEIWEMPLLRHVNIWHLSLPNPPPHGDDDVCVLQNLQTLAIIRNLKVTEEVCKIIPNIKKLEICYGFIPQSEAYLLENIGCFNKLECLRYVCKNVPDLLQNIKFPSSLKKLRLQGCKLEWSYMAAIASLPHLEYLLLYQDAVAATEWVFMEEKFASLKHLNIWQCGEMTKWIVQSSNFPVLEVLEIWDLPELNEIPSRVGEIPTLREISLHYCNESLNISAVAILHEQEMYENLGLQVEITTTEADMLREKVRQLDLTCQNLVILDP